MARVVRFTVFGVLLALIALPAFSQPPSAPTIDLLEGHASVAGLRHYLAHPDQAPSPVRSRFETARALVTQGGTRSLTARGAPFGDLFNRDTVGLPQDEESVSVCTTNPNIVLGGTNDFRGILDPQQDFTGWHFSTNGGRSITNEGLLPPVQINGAAIPSSGDPVDVIGKGCALYAGSLSVAAEFIGFGKTTSGVAVYRSTPHRLATCPQGSSAGGLTHPACWPTSRVIDVAAPGHFLDKEWMDVGRSGTAGQVVWIAYGDLSEFNEEGLEEAGTIKAVRCTADLSSCTKPIVLSAGQKVAEYPSVTIGPDGRTYITWGQFFGGSFTGGAQKGWIAVAEPGSTTFTVRQAVPTDPLIMRGRGKLHANDFRTGTMFKNTVKLVNGRPRVFVVWEHCTARLDQICEEPRIQLTYSSDLGRTWSRPQVITAGGDNYFPELDTDPATGAIVGTWYTNRFDPIFHNRQDVELVRLSDRGLVLRRIRVTKTSNETEADPIVGGTFIGDYIEVSANRGRAYVHYNANERHVRLFGEGLPIPQQDNYLTIVNSG
jgi:hypothetical protein